MTAIRALKLYAGYVKQMNALNAELAELHGEGHASGTNPEFAELTRRLGFEYEDPMTDRLTNHWITLHQERYSRRLQAAARDGRVGARVHARLQGHGEEEIRRGVLPQHLRC